MKVAVCHDRLMERSGGERVALVLAKAFDADLFTAKYVKENTFEWGRKLRVKEVGFSLEAPISQFSTAIWMLDAIKFSQLKELKKYDLLITSGQLAHFASVQNPNNVWYCHTPNRALYDLHDEVRSRLGSLWKPAFDVWTKFWTPQDQKSVKHVRRIVVNSKNVRNRVRRFYKRDAEIVYPPVDIKKFRHNTPEDYWLSVQRIEPEKRLEIQLKVFERLPDEKLVIVGKGRHGRTYQKKVSRWIERLPNVKWIKEASDKELVELYSRCKGVIQTPLEEDFGFVPVEAMASGKPCIAVNEGGFRESIIHGKTGLLVKKPYVENFVKSLKNFHRYKFDHKMCIRHAKMFSEEEFVKNMKSIVRNFGGATIRLKENIMISPTGVEER